MKAALLCVAVALCVATARAQDYYYGVEPAPSMYAQMNGQQMPSAAAPAFVNEQGQPIPPAPSMDAIMAGSQMQQFPPYESVQGAAFVEQPQYVPVQAQAQAPAPFATQEAQVEETEEEETEEADTEADAEAEEETEEETDSEEEGEEAEVDEAAGDDARFAERGHKHKKHGKKHHKHGKKHHKKHGKKGKHGKGKGKGKHGKGKGKGKGKKTFKPKLGAPKNDARSPSAKTPKAAGGRPLPPMPAPLAKKPKINCKKSPHLCITAETPAEGEEPGDHSPKAVFKKKMEVIREALLKNNRNIAEEMKWLDQVTLIMKKYTLKSTKVREHIADERKAIKELLRQRRIILNEKRQKELEMKLKMATTELSALTDALSQVQKKEKELGSGKGKLGSKIKLLVAGLKKLKTDKVADEKQALKKADF